MIRPAKSLLNSDSPREIQVLTAGIVNTNNGGLLLTNNVLRVNDSLAALISTNFNLLVPGTNVFVMGNGTNGGVSTVLYTNLFTTQTNTLGQPMLAFVETNFTLFLLGNNVPQTTNVVHGLGRVPSQVRWVLVSQGTNAGYMPGDELDVNSFKFRSGTSDYGISLTTGVNTNSIFAAFDSGNGPVAVITSTAGTNTTTAVTRWRMKCYVRP